MFNTSPVKTLVGLLLCLIFHTSAFAAVMNPSQTSKKGSIKAKAATEEEKLIALLKDFTRYANKVSDDWNIPGMAIAIVQGDELIYARGFGGRNDHYGPVNPDTLFNIASLSKSFTATLLAMQIDEGKYQWNTKVRELYPDFKLYTPELTNQFEVADLISHRSGLPENAGNELFSFGYNAEHMIHSLRYIKPIAEFRSTFAYQNLFLVLAQKIIEKTDGQSYKEQLRKKILWPLNMKISNVASYEELPQLTNVALPHVYYQGKNYRYKPPCEKNQKPNENVAVASGGINSSAADLAAWLMFNMNDGKKKGVQIVSKKNMDFIHSPQTIIKKSKEGKILEAYGEGWFIDKSEYQPYDVIYHAGGNPGVQAIMAYIPDKKIGIVVLTNQSPNKVPEILYKRFFDMYLHRVPSKDWNTIYLEERKKKDTQEDENIRPVKCQQNEDLELEKYVGTYYNPVYENITVVRKKDQLILSIGHNDTKWLLTPCGNHVFKIYWPNPYSANIPTLHKGEDMLSFSVGVAQNDGIKDLIIPFLNKDNLGVFKSNR